MDSVGSKIQEKQTLDLGQQGACVKLVQNIDVPVFVVQEDKIVYSNAAIQSLSGYTDVALSGMDVGRLILPEHILKLQDDTGEHHQVCLLHRDGGERWLDVVSTEAVFSGTPSFVLFCSDITDRRKAEQALRDSEQILRSITTSAGDGIVLVDDHGVVTFWNRAAKKMFGYSKREALGKNAHDLLGSQADRQAAAKGLEKFRKSGKGAVIQKTLEMMARTKDRTALPVELSVSAFKLKGTWNAVGIIRDITQRRKTESQLEAANWELDTFSSVLAHDLRTPLQAIEGFGGELKTSYGEALDRRGREYVDKVLQASRRMSSVIDGLQMLSRVSRIEICQTTVDLSKLAERISQELLESRQPKKPVRFTITPDMSAWCDGQLMRIALTNLFDNALRFAAKKRKPHIEFSMEMVEGKPTYFIHDNGEGFYINSMEEIFVPFCRLDENPDHEGGGVELAAVQCIIQRHSGRIWVESQPGQGATFFFTL